MYWGKIIGTLGGLVVGHSILGGLAGLTIGYWIDRHFETRAAAGKKGRAAPGSGFFSVDRLQL